MEKTTDDTKAEQEAQREQELRAREAEAAAKEDKSASTAATFLSYHIRSIRAFQGSTPAMHRLANAIEAIVNFKYAQLSGVRYPETGPMSLAERHARLMEEFHAAAAEVKADPNTPKVFPIDDIVKNTESIAKVGKELKWVRQERGALLQIDDDEWEFAKELAKKLVAGGKLPPFKISRDELAKRFPDEAAKFNHSMVVVPDPENDPPGYKTAQFYGWYEW